MKQNDFVELAEIFQNHMTLQREKEIHLFGKANVSQEILVWLDDQLLYQGKISKGTFDVVLPPQKAAENCTLRIRNGEGKEKRFFGVDIGEVWIAAGQSNMEFPLMCDRNGDALIGSARDEHLRYYEVGKYAFEGEREEKLKDDSRWNCWRKFLPEECTHFSAAATYFARILREELQIPVAIVGCCWGGTSASAWIAEAVLREDQILRVYTDAYDKSTEKLNLKKYLRGDYKKRKFMGAKKNAVGADLMMKKEVTRPLGFPVKQLVKRMISNQQTGPHDSNRPGGLYQTMLKKIIGFTVRGVIWYQGESDEQYADIYDRLFTRLILEWRKEWKEDFPFLFVQLAPWDEWMAQDGRNFPRLRAQQQKVEDQLENAYMASVMDAGSRFDIHPKEKEPVGRRLALLALENVYGIEQKECRAPRISKITREEENITVTFDYAMEGLMVTGEVERFFSVKQEGREIKMTGEVRDNRIILRCCGLKKGKAELSFAYQPFLSMNIFNREGIAARPLAPQEI